MKNEPLTIKVGELTFSTFQEKQYEPGVKNYSPWRWHCKAANGEIVCTSGESFDSKGNAERAMKGFIASMLEGFANAQLGEIAVLEPKEGGNV